MATGYEVQMYNDLRQIAQSLNRIANVLEAQEKRAREQVAIDPDSLGAMALWREEVANHNCSIGFSDWLAWHESDRAEVEAAVRATTPEDIEALAPAIQAVRRGFDEMEAQVRAQKEAKGDGPQTE